MACSTFRCCQVSQRRLFSMKSLPTARKISATSMGGCFTSSVVSSRVSLHQSWKDPALPKDSLPPANGAVTSGDTRWYQRALHDRVKLESCAGRLLLQACE